MTVDIRPPQTADVALNAAVAAVGLRMQVEEFPHGLRRYVIWGRRGVAGIVDADGRAFRTLPAEWMVELRETELDGDPVGDPTAREWFTAEEVDAAAGWIRAALDQLGHDVTDPDPAPIAAAPTEHLPVLRADTRPVPVPPPADPDSGHPDPSDPEENTPMPHAAPRRHRIRPGRQHHLSWPADLDVTLSGPEKPDPAVRVWSVWVRGQFVGHVVGRRYPLPDPGWIRKHRTVWSSYYIRDNTRTDLTGRGRESRRGAVAVLMWHWMTTFRGLGR